MISFLTSLVYEYSAIVSQLTVSKHLSMHSAATWQAALAAQLFIGRFREPEPAGRSLPRTTEASSGPSPATPCPATDLPERSTKLAVVHGSENQLFGWLQNVGWASYP